MLPVANGPSASRNGPLEKQRLRLTLFDVSSCLFTHHYPARPSGQLSVQQRTAMFTIVSVHRSIQKKQPAYNYSRLQPNSARSQGQTRSDYKLSLSRGSFYYRGSKLYNQLPVNLIQQSNQALFKKEVKKWVSVNIPVQPP